MTVIPGAREIKDPEAEMARLAGLRTGNGSQPEAEWKVAVAGRDGEITIKGATVSHDPGEAPMTTFRDAAGEIVFQAQTAAIIYLRR